eukprot:394100_1
MPAPAIAWFILVITFPLRPILSAYLEYRNGEVSSPFTFDFGDSILSHGGSVRLVMQGDGNLLMQTYSSGSAWNYADWKTTTKSYGHHVNLQDDGQLVVFDDTGGIRWQSNSIIGTSPFRLIVTDDIAAYILDSLNKIVWSTNPSFARFETIWSESFDTNDQGWYQEGDVIFPSTSYLCPNYPDACAEVPWKNTGDCCWTGKQTAISSYSAIQLQVDIRGYNLESVDGDACEIWWAIDGEEAEKWTIYDTLYTNDVYKDVIVDFPLPDSYATMYIDLQVYGDATSDQCFFDNAILRGILTESPTELSPTSAPTKQPSESTQGPTNQPTHKPTALPSNIPTTSPTKNPSAEPTKNPSVSPTRNPSIAPTNNPSVSPTKPPEHNPSDSQETTSSSGVTDNTDSPGTNSMSTVVILMVIIGVLILCVVMGIVGFVCRTTRNKRDEINVDRIVSQSSNDKQIVYQMNDVHHIEPQNTEPVIPPGIASDENQYDVDDNGDERIEGEGNVNINEFGTPNGALPNIASDEFVVVGDDEHQDEETYQTAGNTNQGSLNVNAGHAIASGERN